MEFFRRLKLRCIWSWAGVVATWVNEPSFRSWVWANLISAALALILPLTLAERALILALGVLVLAAELLTQQSKMPSTISQPKNTRWPNAPKTRAAPVSRLQLLLPGLLGWLS